MLNTTTNLKQSLLVFSAVLSLGTMVLSAPLARAATCAQGTWRYGNSGPCVSNIQLLLNYEGGYFRYANWSNLSVDGQFGPLTRGQVKAFQAYTGNQQDGIVGPHTWGSLCDKAPEVIDYFNTIGSYKRASALLAIAQDAGCRI